ncbi:OmpA/MotB family protein [Phaeodactylibacter luteus]|nr:OmpA family protein [Phaeodactylibacter luteus]
MSRLALFIFLALSLSACVSKKKYLAGQAAAAFIADSLSTRLKAAEALVYQLRLDTAERRGENTALLQSQANYQERIIRLDDEVERLQQELRKEVKGLDANIQARDAIIEAQKARLSKIEALLNLQDSVLGEMARQLQDTLPKLDSTAFTIEVSNHQLVLGVFADYLFAPGSTSKLQPEADSFLQVICPILQLQPGLDIEVLGHTNNEPLRRSSIDSKWEYSAMRAATLANRMARDYEVSSSRIKAAGKGDFAPKASNATPEGRRLNHRIEWVVGQGHARFLRDLRRLLE